MMLRIWTSVCGLAQWWWVPRQGMSACMCARVLKRGKGVDLEEPNPNDGYDYMQHGFDWPGLQEGGTTKYPACSGSNQSPIDINTNQLMEPSSRSGTSAVSLNGLNVDGAQADGITLTNAKVDLEQGMKVTFDQPAANLPTIEIGGTTKSFVPIQFHFHHFLSEHTINGIHYPLELHIVMQEQDPADVATAQLAVIGIMYKYSENGDAFLNSLQTQIEGKIGDGKWCWDFRGSFGLARASYQ
eukprot:661815-Pelagomonas_calceolata.AAC.3